MLFMFWFLYTYADSYVTRYFKRNHWTGFSFKIVLQTIGLVLILIALYTFKCLSSVSQAIERIEMLFSLL
jgi:hypothetical protein